MASYPQRARGQRSPVHADRLAMLNPNIAFVLPIETTDANLAIQRIIHKAAEDCANIMDQLAKCDAGRMTAFIDQMHQAANVAEEAVLLPYGPWGAAAAAAKKPV